MWLNSGQDQTEAVKKFYAATAYPWCCGKGGHIKQLLNFVLDMIWKKYMEKLSDEMFTLMLTNKSYYMNFEHIIGLIFWLEIPSRF